MIKAKRKVAVLIWCILCAFTLSCSQVAVTGRRQLNLVPRGTIQQMSYQQYSEFLSQARVVTGTERSQMVKRVGRNIQQAVTMFCADDEDCNLEGYEWEFNLIDDEVVNAWALPGGKVVIYTGMFKIIQDETDLAVVMGHEIAHAIARHGGERMSQGLVVQFGGMALSQALANKPAATQELFMQSYGIGTQVGVLLPYSRVHEKEADNLGLIFMAMAGYDPSEAVDFWQRMAELSEAAAPPEFLSTHPSEQTRIQHIKQVLPRAMKYYKPN